MLRRNTLVDEDNFNSRRAEFLEDTSKIFLFCFVFFDTFVSDMHYQL